MADITAPPTMSMAGLRKLYDQLKESHRRRATLDKELDDLFFNEHKVEVVESPVLGVEPEVLRLGRVPSAINLIEGLFDQYPVYSVISRGSGVNAQREAERIERVLNAIVKQAEREGREDTYDLTKQDVFRFGRSFETVVRADHYWDKYPERKTEQSDKSYNKETEGYKSQAPLPIIIRHIPIAPSSDGIQALPLLAGSRMIRFIRVHDMQVAEILDRFGMEGQGRRPESLLSIRAALNGPDGLEAGVPPLLLTDTLKCIEYFDPVRIIYAIVDQRYEGIVREWKHDQGCLPVVMYEGIVTGDPHPERRWKAVYHDAKEAVLHEDRLASRQATNVRINYYKSYYGLADESAVEGSKGKTIEFTPGQLTILHGLKQFGAVDTQSVSQEAQLLEAKLERMLELHLLPSVLMGAQGANEEASWGTNIRLRQAEKRFKTIAGHLASARVELGQAIMRVIMSIGERVYAIDDEDKEWSITPKEAEAYINRIRVKIEPKTITDFNANVDAAEGLERLGVPKRVYFEDVLGYEQPVELMRERVLEDAQFDPSSPLYQQTLQDILKQADLLEQEEEAATESDITAAIGGEDVGPGAAQALAELVGGAGNGATPTIPINMPGFNPTQIPPATPQEQAMATTGRKQGRQPRPRRAPRSTRNQ